MSKLLMDERPLVILPSLAKAIGLNEAVFLQQLHFFLKTKEENEDRKGFQEGRYWVWNSYPEWQEIFPFWSVATIRRVISELEKKGLVLTGNFNELAIDQTKWYTIDYEVFRKLEEEVTTSQPRKKKSVSRWSAQNEQLGANNCKMSKPSAQNEQAQVLKMSRPLPKTSSETSTKTSLSFASQEREFAALPPEVRAWYEERGLGKYLDRAPALLQDAYRSCLADEDRADFPGAERRVLAVLSGKYVVPAEEPEPEPARKGRLAFCTACQMAFYEDYGHDCQGEQP